MTWHTSTILLRLNHVFNLCVSNVGWNMYNIYDINSENTFFRFWVVRKLLVLKLCFYAGALDKSYLYM